ncbi:MAG TPA: FAD-dependent oxidoreductase [Thermoanaerobaculia bacterium]|nr:FAD-dependent oxidoreductase [Thermoanaerobaculia bacterium]
MSRSLWIASTDGNHAEKIFPSLSGDIEADVAIVGAGITGIVSAYLLAREGKRVALVEARGVGEGETGRTTAHLSEQIDARFREVTRQFGADEARRVAEGGRIAIDRIEAIAGSERIDCSFRTVPAFLYASGNEELGALDEEAECARSAGIAAVRVDETPLPFAVAGAIRFERQAEFHPLRFLHALARRAAEVGALIFEGTRALGVEDGEQAIVETDRGRIRAREVIVASHVPLGQRGILVTRLPAYRTYALAARIETPLEPGLYWDTDEPYHYVRTVAGVDGVRIIAGGEDHRTGSVDDPAARHRALEQWVRERFRIGAIEHRWSGQILEPPDGLPFVGLTGLSRHVRVATGYSGQGMTFGVLSAIILTEQILGRVTPWDELFHPNRIPPAGSLPRHLSENLGFPLHLLKDRIADRDVSDRGLDSLGAGEGRIIEIGGEKLAAARDESGALHLHSPVCPHLGCDVRWNRAEGSWDCPCHGSRFDVEGALLNGPAVEDLRKAKKQDG